MSQKRILDFLGGKKILVLCGGSSSERLPSLQTGKKVFDCLVSEGFEAELFDLEDNKLEFIKKGREAGLVFLGLHGGYGENGTIQGLLDFWQIPYTGSGILGSSIGMNKLITKKILRSELLPTADFVAFEDTLGITDFVEESESKCGYPMMVKVWDEGSGNGVFFVKNNDEFNKALRKIGNLHKVFVEKYVIGREIAVGIIEENGKIRILPVLESLYQDDFFSPKVRSNTNKYRKDIEAELDESVKKQIVDVCSKTHRALQAKVYSRIDIKLENNTNIPYVLEITTLPGLTENSWLPKVAAMAGISFSKLLNLIILASIEKYDK